MKKFMIHCYQHVKVDETLTSSQKKKDKHRYQKESKSTKKVAKLIKVLTIEISLLHELRHLPSHRGQGLSKE